MEKTMHLIVFVSLVLWLSAGCTGHAKEGHATIQNTLSPCPDSPNCVSTMSTDPGHAMSPLPYMGTLKESRERLIQVLHGMERCTIVTVDPGYIHAEFRSALFGFVDDVNFIFDDNERLIHFRSASRTGYYDFGVNRKRMTEISARYLNKLQKSD